MKDSSELSAIHAEEGGAAPTQPLHFSSCALKDVAWFVKEHHYSHSHPGGIDYSFRCDMAGKLVGVCLYGHIAGNPRAAVVTECQDPKRYRELMRLVLLDEIPKNSESQFIGWTLRELRRITDLVGVVSFADPHYGHEGIVYKASNWVYLGLQKTPRPRLIIDGVEKHPKSCYNIWGTSSIPKLESLGHVVHTAVREPKHKFAYSFRKDFPILKE